MDFDDKEYQKSLLGKVETVNEEMTARITEQEREFGQLWKVFFETIAIEERMNPVCQRTHLPLHFREDMIEFQTVCDLHDE